MLLLENEVKYYEKSKIKYISSPYHTENNNKNVKFTDLIT